jgi:HTH-type transcriptional regulator / antitoxin HigA
MRNFRTLDEFAEQYFGDRPDEIDDYLAKIFQEFAEDSDTGALLASLRVLARVQGISNMATQIGMTRQGVQKALSDDGNPPPGKRHIHHESYGLLFSPTETAFLYP